jgi:hypothetical protein
MGVVQPIRENQPYVILPEGSVLTECILEDCFLQYLVDCSCDKVQSVLAKECLRLRTTYEPNEEGKT